MISIKQTQYRGKQGFLIYGSKQHKGLAIFAMHRDAAERIKAKKLRNEDLTVDDFYSRAPLTTDDVTAGLRLCQRSR